MMRIQIALEASLVGKTIVTTIFRHKEVIGPVAQIAVKVFKLSRNNK